MKNVNYIVNGVLAIAVIVLFVLHFTGNKGQTVTRTINAENFADATMPVAYVNIDSLLLNYNFYNDLNEILLKKQENARANLRTKMQDLEKEISQFQQKVNTNSFLTRERAEQEQERLLKKQQDLQELDERTVYDLQVEQLQMDMQLRDSIVHQLKVFNEKYGFQIIYSNNNSDNILYANDAYDVTEEFTKFLNGQYSGTAQ